MAKPRAPFPTKPLAVFFAVVLASETAVELVLPKLWPLFGWHPTSLHKIALLILVSTPFYILFVVHPLRRALLSERSASNDANEHEERFRLLSLATDDLVWDSDPVTNRVWFGGATEKFGYKPGVSDKDRTWWGEQIHPDDRERVLSAARLAFEGHQPGWNEEYRLRRADGTYAYVAARAYIVRDSDGNVRRMIGATTDITDRRLAEERLRASEAHFRLIVDRAPAMVWMTGPEHGNIFVNKAWLDFTGRSLEEEAGDGWAETLHPEDRDCAFRTFVAAREARVPLTMEVRFLRHDGEYRWIQTSGAPRFESDGSFAGYIGSCVDVTDLKVVQAGLAAARDEAIRSAQLKALFLANMSHEIRTPMNGVIGMTALLLDTDLSSEQREYADAVRTSSEALLAVINDILYFSKIEAGKLELETVDFDLRSTVEDVVCLLAERADAKGIELNCLIDEGVPAVVAGDPGRVRQILTNLVGNAVKFTSEGEVIVRARLAEETAAGALLRFEVSDTGIGIAAEAQGGLFQSFSQADGATARRYGGTGLGLAISKQLVELMGGEIGLLSVAGSGSSFWFTTRFAVRSAVDPAVGNPEPELAGARVLCADDNATSRLAFARRLSAWGLTVDCVADGPAAIARLRAARDAGAPYHLALIDYGMPGMDGLELAAAIKRDAGLAQTPLVLMTPWTQRGEAAAARKAGVWGCLTKPARRTNLHDCVVLALRSGGASAPPPIAPSRGRILVVEDNRVNQKLTSHVLQKLGYHADVAANGVEAIAALARAAYDAVLMDCQMPEMDGYEATAEVRRREAGLQRTAIIAMTASDLPADRERCLASGMDGFVTKPIRPEDLAAAIERWARPATAAPPASASSTAASSASAPPAHSAPTRDRAI